MNCNWLHSWIVIDIFVINYQLHGPCCASNFQHLFSGIFVKSDKSCFRKVPTTALDVVFEDLSLSNSEREDTISQKIQSQEIQSQLNISYSVYQ